MTEYTEVEQPFLEQLQSLGWTPIDQGQEIPQDPRKSLRQTFRQWILPDVFAKAVTGINKTADGENWLTDKQITICRIRSCASLIAHFWKPMKPFKS